jgi:hypothetical protein
MTIFLILAPFGAFTFLMLLTSTAASVFAAAATCLLAVAVDVARSRSVKMLPAGSAIMFAGIGFYVTLVDPALNATAVRLAVDIGVFTISLGSMLIGRPFTLQYALESVPAETAAMPGFVYANYVITAAWTAATLLMMAANIALIYVPGLPIWSGLAVAFAARYSAICFTKWYPDYCRSRFGTAAAQAVPASH